MPSHPNHPTPAAAVIRIDFALFPSRTDLQIWVQNMFDKESSVMQIAGIK